MAVDVSYHIGIRTNALAELAGKLGPASHRAALYSVLRRPTQDVKLVQEN
jgi:hypothetical protein